MQELKAVVYQSQAVHRMTARELDGPLIGARPFNEKAKVTGALLHDAGTFLQYFEGPPEGVERVYARIRQSSQHEQLVELLNEPIDTRQFARWHMAFCNAPPSVLKEIANEMWTRTLPDLRAKHALSPGLQLLLDFWEQSGPHLTAHMH